MREQVESGLKKEKDEKEEGMGDRRLGRRKEKRGWRREEEIWNKGKKRWEKGDKGLPTAGVILELSEREKFSINFRISGRSFGPNFVFLYTFYTFSLLPQLKIGRSQSA